MKSHPKAFHRTKPDIKSGKTAKTEARRPALAAIPPEQILYGIHAVEAALANPKRHIRHAYLSGNAALKLEPLIAARRIPATAVAPHDFDALLGGGAVHQGAVLVADPLLQPELEDFLAALKDEAPARVAILDQVTDPHNVGAVLRSAAAFGIAALIVQDRHSPPLTGSLAKVASGALEHVPVIATVNLARALDRLKDHGFVCLGFDSGAPGKFGAAAASAPRGAYVFGAEDKGLRRLIRERCDALYAVPAPGKIKSLNISNAAAIVFYEGAKPSGPQ